MNQLLKIDYSPSFKGFSSFLGLAVIAFGALMFIGISESMLFLFPALIFLIMGFLLFLKFRGVVLDGEQKKIRVYNDYLLFRSGGWESVEGYNQIKIVLEKVSVSSKQNRFSSYEVCLANSFNGDIYVLKELSNLKDAQALQMKVASALSITCIKVVERVELSRRKSKK